MVALPTCCFSTSHPGQWAERREQREDSVQLVGLALRAGTQGGVEGQALIFSLVKSDRI